MGVLLGVKAEEREGEEDAKAAAMAEFELSSFPKLMTEPFGLRYVLPHQPGNLIPAPLIDLDVWRVT